VKPPVHGWALGKLLTLMDPPEAEIGRVYPKLVALTEWWLSQRDLDDDGLCEYFHGNDSGQDDSAAFDMGFPAVAPDLATYLILQLDTLGALAARLGVDNDGREAKSRADAMSDAMIAKLWNGRSFDTRHALTGDVAIDNMSQIRFVPLLLGDRLPPRVRAAMIDDLRTSGQIVGCGVASESPRSTQFAEDGYWRGAVWAPTTYLIIDGLRACGEADMAREIAAGFVHNTVRAGFAENYAASDGRSLRDPSYSWSAAVFWRLAIDYGL